MTQVHTAGYNWNDLLQTYTNTFASHQWNWALWKHMAFGWRFQVSADLSRHGWPQWEWNPWPLAVVMPCSTNWPTRNHLFPPNWKRDFFSFLLAVSSGHRIQGASRGHQGYHSNIDSFLVFPRPAVWTAKAFVPQHFDLISFDGMLNEWQETYMAISQGKQLL